MRPLFLLGLALALAAPLAAQDRTRSPHGELALECETCHRSDGWTPAKISRVFDHSRYGFPLVGAHKTSSCRSCHEGLDFKEATTTCASCHQDVHRGELGADCTRCHTPRSFLDRSTMTRAHQSTRFPLEGGHLTTDCTNCHKPTDQGRMQFVAMSADCWSCHQPQFTAAKAPDHVASGMPHDCSGCHNTVMWGRGKFNHDATRFPLTGAHRAAVCTECHTNGRYQGTPLTCVDCHQTQFDRSTQPNHRQAGFTTDCVGCHVTTAWNTGFDHGKTQFPLNGAHSAVTCQQCHGDGLYGGRPTTCVSCHQTDYNNTTTPKHSSAGFPTDCQACHTEVVWTGAVYNHDATQFPLTGAHKATTCAQCHGDGIYKGKPTACSACHQADYTATTNPKHTTPAFPSTCATCHTTVAWLGATINHDLTRFPLTGNHRAATCDQCHKNGQYTGTPMTCVSCHQAEFNATTNPNHTTAGFPTDCHACHTTTTHCTGAVLNHDATQFPLTGAHKATTCAQCHSDGVYNGKSTASASCHQADYNGTTNPKHTQPSFPTNCTACHTTTSWLGATFNHSLTAFPLTGAHQATLCADCHTNGIYTGTPSTCIGCHQADYNTTTNPPHGAAGFSTTCTSCHSTNQWTGAIFNHGATQFPLTGAHVTTACSGCHADGVYNGKPTTCISCHQTDFNTTTNPPHQAAGFSTTCTPCHTTTTWVGGTFNHSTTQFPLTGAHTTTACSACHADGVYNGKPTTCVSCHQTDYNQTTNPNHTASGFSNNCVSCHTTTTWLGATFDHDGQFFPIYSGKHKNKWSTCSECHQVPTDYGQFTCLTCHEHNKSSMDSEHRGRSGYAYISTECLRCHPRGS